MLRGAIALNFRQATLVPELHGKADNGAPFLLEQGGDRRGVDTTGHSDGDKPGLNLGARRECGLELCRLRHGLSYFIAAADTTARCSPGRFLRTGGEGA